MAILRPPRPIGDKGLLIMIRLYCSIEDLSASADQQSLCRGIRRDGDHQDVHCQPNANAAHPLSYKAKLGSMVLQACKIFGRAFPGGAYWGYCKAALCRPALIGAWAASILPPIVLCVLLGFRISSTSIPVKILRFSAPS